MVERTRGHVIPKKLYAQFDYSMKQINAISAGNVEGNVAQSKIVVVVRAIVPLQQRGRRIRNASSS